jgi:hypothetical protein
MHPTVSLTPQLTRRWTSLLGIRGRHRSVQVDAFIVSAHIAKDAGTGRAHLALECGRQLQSVLCDIEDDSSPAGQLLCLQS